MRKGILMRAVLAGVAFALAGCLLDKAEDQGTEVDIVPTPDPNTYVCNPLGDGTGTDARDQGLKGELFYVPPGAPTYPIASDYIANAVKIEEIELFFNQLFIPTRPFDRGFVTQGGITLAAADGTTLYEYFAIRFQSQLKLAEGQAPGLYQLAILSDDGAVMTMDSGALTVVDNDGWHSTRMGCATQPIQLNAGESLPFELNYFQGPRYHIAMTLMWRPWPANPGDVNDPLCGRAGNSFWFDSTQDPPAPTANYSTILSRGWQVVSPDNFKLPSTGETNPCNEPAPELSAVAVGSVSKDTAVISWVTDRPATSQASVTEVATGITNLTIENSALVVPHSVTITGLKANTQYKVKAISKSSSGRSSESSEITFRTSR